MVKEAFRSELYVPREEPLKSLLDWVHQHSPEFRLRSVIGPAGIGKSWFLANLYLRLIERNHCLVLWMDLGVRSKSPSNSDPLPEMTSPDGQDEWLETAIDLANHCCDVRTVAGGPFSQRFKAFISSLCRECKPGSTIVLLVDGFDELTSIANRNYFQERVFAEFLGQPCTRIILARRDEHMLTHHYLRWNEELIQLSGLEADQPEDQLVRRKRILQDVLRNEDRSQKQVRLQELLPGSFEPAIYKRLESLDANELDTIVESIIRYIPLTPNPLINTCLFSHAVTRNPVGLNPNALRLCIQEVADRAGIKRQAIDVLQKIVYQLPHRWTARELYNKLQLDVNDPNIEALFQSAVIFHVPGTTRYATDTGMHQLISKFFEHAGKTNGIGLEAAP